MKHFLTVLLLFIIPVLAVIAVVFLTVDTPITIMDSGSTNSQPFGLTINPDGSGYDNTGNDADVNYFDSATFNYQRLVNAIRTKDNLMALFVNKATCPHSASFGTTRTLTYNWIVSGDTTCVSNQELMDAVTSVVQAANLPVTNSPLGIGISL